MKYFISINQKALLDNDIKINLVQAVIFDFLYDFISSGCADQVTIDNKNYSWISYQHVIDSLPIIEITNKNVICRNIQKLVDVELLGKYVDKKQGNKTFFCVGKRAKELLFSPSKVSTEKLIPIDSKVETSLLNSSNPSYLTVDTLSTLKSNNSYIINSNNNINKELPSSKADAFSECCADKKTDTKTEIKNDTKTDSKPVQKTKPKKEKENYIFEPTGDDWEGIVAEWDEVYKETYNIPYEFTGKDFSQLKALLSKAEKTDYIYNYQFICYFFRDIFQECKKNKFFYDRETWQKPITIGMILSMWNDINYKMSKRKIYGDY